MAEADTRALRVDGLSVDESLDEQGWGPCDIRNIAAAPKAPMLDTIGGFS
jgi:hypothetical protein